MTVDGIGQRVHLGLANAGFIREPRDSKAETWIETYIAAEARPPAGFAVVGLLLRVTDSPTQTHSRLVSCGGHLVFEHQLSCLR